MKYFVLSFNAEVEFFSDIQKQYGSRIMSLYVIDLILLKLRDEVCGKLDDIDFILLKDYKKNYILFCAEII